MLPLKWKIFRISNYLHIGGTVLLAGTLIQQAIKFRLHTTDDIAIFSLVLFCTLILIINSIINMILLERFYPDKRPGQALTISARIFFILSILILLSGAVAVIYGIIETINYYNKYPRNFPLLPQLLFNIWIIGIILTGMHICCRQPLLRKTIRRNHDSILDNFLENEES